jgi:hypothetical protein
VITLLAIAVLLVVALGVGGFIALVVVVVVQTAQRKGRWGINTRPVTCPECGAPAPAIRAPKNASQALWGGWTCPGCRCEVDKWGVRR